MGRNGDGLGYDGIVNSLAVEFDTFANLDDNGDGDPYTQHIRYTSCLRTIIFMRLFNNCHAPIDII